MATTQSDRPASPFVEPWEPSQRTIFVTAIVVALIASLSTANFVAQRIWFTPEAAVKGYYGALADRDAAKAASYLSNNDTTLAAALISSDKYVPPSGLKVDSIREDDEDSKGRSAQVDFSIGDTKATGSMSLRRSEDLSWGLFRGWDITGNRPALQISSSIPVDVQVNGQRVDLESGDLNVFPGRYVVQVADNPLVESDPVSVDAGFENVEVQLAPRIKSTIETEAQAQIKAYLKQCLTEATKPEHSCPFSFGYSDITNPVWRIDTYPTVELELDSSGEGIVVHSNTEGEATVTGTYDGAPYTDTDTFSVSGTITVDQGKVTFQPE
ncbi:hypothetical protein EV646_105356 [Kribbella antiqua]|uniref:Uncharacterized protein n=1 Tax=Kribbella antiqua TaxID=2512217 RepID=A0A4R2IU48_9ACTN|nr:hypothetical protein [Kribbella antiqua]TCO47799.1 hypothetical protein EV646_105356 [Kribbella antiqua]